MWKIKRALRQAFSTKPIITGTYLDRRDFFEKILDVKDRGASRLETGRYTAPHAGSGDIAQNATPSANVE